jgi:uncharacterized membrane protein YgcG
MKKFILNNLSGLSFIIFIFVLILIPFKSEARTSVTEWYIKDMQSNITVNKDSSQLITETIIADCGNLTDKHGIYRILPTIYKTDNKSVITPIELISITDQNKNPIKYQTLTNNFQHTLTWKIGDPDVTVQGENTYIITYLVKNTIRFENENFDEFYWNLSGNFWDMEIDRYTAKISFPNAITETNSEIFLYSGGSYDSSNEYVSSKWINNSLLEIISTKTLPKETGITASVTFPKNIIIPYKLTFWEQYGQYLFLLIPFFVFLICWVVWSKYGRDPRLNPTIAPEFDIPENFSPMEMGMIYTDAIMKQEFISASIINLAVKKIIKIEEIEAKGLFESKDFKLILLNKDYSKLRIIEIILVDKLFAGKEILLISDLKNKFYKNVEEISKQIKNDLVKKRLLIKYSRTLQISFIISAFVFVIIGFVAISLSIFAMIGTLVSAAIMFIFSFLATKRTVEGAEMKRRIEGFKLYLNTAERYRQQFNEKENIFDVFLPYAIMFGMTKEWIKKMKTMYGEEKFNAYAPYWYTGIISGSFDANSFTDSIQSMSSEMASTLSSSPSGSGGSGFSGGGGGGGGGGGW